MSEILIEATGLHKTYRLGSAETKVLKGIDLSIPEHGLMAIVGASGAGKSTLLHILGSLDAPTEGNVLFGGRDIYRLKDSVLSSLRNREIGFVFQFHHLLPEFTALENVMMPLLIQGEARAEVRRKSETLLERLGVAHRSEHLPAELSGGEQQRVATARALVTSPRVLFADEPTGNLDHETGERMMALLFECHRESRMALVLVTHNQEVASRFPQKVLLEDGRMKGRE